MTPISSASRSFINQTQLKKKDLTPVGRKAKISSIFKPQELPKLEKIQKLEEPLPTLIDRTVDEFSINVTTEVEVPMKLEDHLRNEMPLQ